MSSDKQDTNLQLIHRSWPFICKKRLGEKNEGAVGKSLFWIKQDVIPQLLFCLLTTKKIEKGEYIVFYWSPKEVGTPDLSLKAM